ncbi:MAG: ribosome small subunit-dependent GTPase A [Flavobacteriaceae bacterium]|nr:ribosome small subunit-dependent GTPase A [Flavobacteriaceae bacterium]
MLGIVYRSTGSWYKVVTQNEIINCRIQGRLRLSNIKSTNPVVVGDKVLVQKDQLSDNNEGVIVQIKERKNYIIRKSVNLSKQSHIIAANIDQAFLLITLKNPITTTSFIDRFLITAEAYKVKCILVFNKIDTYDKSFKIKMNEMINLYKKIGYSCIKISASKKINVKKIKDLIFDKICVFSGHSGVGKSTLINCLSKNLKIPTTPISEYHQQGQHTTTFAEMYDIDNGAKLIDTPGIKGFGLVNMSKNEISNYFTEFNKFSSRCRFNDCLHLNEPSCAIKKAVNNNEIASSRYSSYIRLLEDHKIYRD